MTKQRKALAAAFPLTIPVMAGYLFLGIDFAMTALFVVIFTDQWRMPGSHPPALVGLLASVICLLLFGAQNFLLPAMGLILLSLILLRRRLRKGGEAQC